MANKIIENPRVVVRSGFGWNRAAAYLFDVDGTLLRSRDRVHFNAFAAAVEQVAGVPICLDTVSTAGNTDTAILAEAWQQTSLPPARLQELSPAIHAAMARYVSERRCQLEPVLMPGVEATLAHLQAQGALLGVATGNLEDIGWTKLERAGLRHWFRLGGFSDHFLVRAEMVADAARRARQMLGNPQATVCVVGDTPRDLAAARAAHLPVLLVATGRYSFEELDALEPEICTDTLESLLATEGAL